MPQNKLLAYLEQIGGGSIGKETPDCAVTKLKHSQSLVTSLDFFYPSVDDPLLQGRIACCNVLSDLYAMGVTDIDQVLMVLGLSRQMLDKEQEVVTRLMVQGFDQCAEEALTKVTGGQTVYNPWPMIGGAAVGAMDDADIIMPYNLREGDLMVLTKPLGTQPAVNAFQWMKNQDAKYDKVSPFVSDQEIESAFLMAVQSMATLNLTASRLMKKHHAHGATDVTGFGMLGHADYLAQVQKQALSIEIDTLPFIAGVSSMEGHARHFKLLEGYSAETSGGLLIGFTPEDARAFMQELDHMGQDSWLVGRVVAGDRTGRLAESVETVQVRL